MPTKRLGMYHVHCSTLEMIMQTMDSGLEIISDELRLSAAERSYRLGGVIFHIGHNAANGHYTCAVSWPPLSRLDDQSIVDSQNLRRGQVEAPSAFLYFDDRNACLIRGRQGITQLLATHDPLNVVTGLFGSPGLPNSRITSSCDANKSALDDKNDETEAGMFPCNTDISCQPRTPYLILYLHDSTAETEISATNTASINRGGARRSYNNRIGRGDLSRSNFYSGRISGSNPQSTQSQDNQGRGAPSRRCEVDDDLYVP
ncbi:unnamed protein product [Protopolystoma xenopodis]|uniref:Uncharacterized protein n=1 Tax=Protopolystoma xenopodis TaxID=117903 RepID=A0A3S5CSV0_9PLAT|nr:unnamed protein product [Protopolystoma xenopodis]